MNIFLFIAIIVFFGSIYLWIGQKASQELNTHDDYFLMGRKLRLFPLCMTILATQLGGGTLLGASEEAYQSGWLVLFYPLGAFLGLVVLGLGFGKKLRELNISTIAEIFEKIYHSRLQRQIASLFSIATLFFILVAQGIAAKKFFATIHLESPYIFIIFWCVLVTYTVMGGLKAVIQTDILQALFIIISLVLAFFSIDSSISTSQSSTISSLPALSSIPWMSWLFMPLLFMLIEQDMGQRCFAAKRSKSISFAAATAGILLFISSSIVIYFGILAQSVSVPAHNSSSILIESVKIFTNPTVATLVVAAIFMAIISTADSLLCSISSNVSYDFILYFKIREKQKIMFSKLITLTTGILALGLTYFFHNIISVLMISYECSVCVLFVPITAAIFTKKPCIGGSALAMLLGSASFCFFLAFTPAIPFPRQILILLLSLTGYFIGKQIRKRLKKTKKDYLLD